MIRCFFMRGVVVLCDGCVVGGLVGLMFGEFGFWFDDGVSVVCGLGGGYVRGGVGFGVGFVF